MSSGEWLVLARTKYMLNELENHIYQNGWYYKNKYKKTKEKELYSAVVDWEHFTSRSTINSRTINKNFSLYEF